VVIRVESDFDPHMPFLHITTMKMMIAKTTAIVMRMTMISQMGSLPSSSESLE
jgi:hypothetical protein